MGDRDEPPGRARTGRERAEPRPEPVARIAGDLLDRALAREGHEHPSGRALRDAHAGRDLGHAGRAGSERAEHGEGPFDALDSGHRTPRRLG